jgi:predicted nucleic acid-binding protein
VAVVELVHGVHRADSAERRARREAFVEELLSTVAVYPLTTDTARRAGKLDAEQQSRGIVVPLTAGGIGEYGETGHCVDEEDLLSSSRFLIVVLRAAAVSV